MTHDPLCPWNQPCPGSYEQGPHEFVPLDTPGLGPVCYHCTSTECECDLIARVREDEASKYGSLRTMHDAVARARSAALRDAVEAVRALTYRVVGTGRPKYVRKADAVAAIEALGGATEPADTGWSSGFWDKR